MCDFPLFFFTPSPSTPLLSICSKSSSICLFVSVTSTIGRQSALFSAINHSVGAITDTLFLGVRRSYTLGDCTAAADGFPGFICPPEQTYDLAAGVTSAEARQRTNTHSQRPHTFVGGGHGAGVGWCRLPGSVRGQHPATVPDKWGGNSKHLRLLVIMKGKLKAESGRSLCTWS